MSTLPPKMSWCATSSWPLWRVEGTVWRERRAPAHGLLAGRPGGIQNKAHVAVDLRNIPAHQLSANLRIYLLISSYRHRASVVNHIYAVVAYCLGKAQARLTQAESMKIGIALAFRRKSKKAAVRYIAKTVRCRIVSAEIIH